MRPRFAEITNPDAIADQLAAEFAEGQRAQYKPRWNVCPQQLHWLTRASDGAGAPKRLIEQARWGWLRTLGPPPEAGKKPPQKLIINTMGETAFQKAMFRKALREFRCVVPATGFYEWTGDKKDRRPIHFRRRDGGLLLLAGIYEEGRQGEAPRFTVLTTTANSTLLSIHDRMPVVLEPAEMEQWLRSPVSTAAPIEALIDPAPDSILIGEPASRLVNSAANEGPALLIAEAQSSLF